MIVFFAQAQNEVVTVDWIGLLLTIGLCVCPVAILIGGIIFAVIRSKRVRKPPE
jgi:ABC-type nickel/cobalt efflux system permease component RcnA